MNSNETFRFMIILKLTFRYTILEDNYIIYFIFPRL